VGQFDSHRHIWRIPILILIPNSRERCPTVVGTRCMCWPRLAYCTIRGRFSRSVSEKHAPPHHVQPPRCCQEDLTTVFERPLDVKRSTREPNLEDDISCCAVKKASFGLFSYVSTCTLLWNTHLGKSLVISIQPNNLSCVPVWKGYTEHGGILIVITMNKKQTKKKNSCLDHEL
jgi:hypothetical protein